MDKVSRGMCGEGRRGVPLDRISGGKNLEGGPDADVWSAISLIFLSETHMKRLVKLCAVLVVTASMVLGQSPKAASSSVPKDAPKSTGQKQEDLRVYQLRIFREHVFTRALDSVKKMDEAGLRLSARNQILSFMATNKTPSDEMQALATQIARDALMEIRDHNEDISPFMLGYLSNDLGSWIQKYRPALNEEFEKTIKSTGKGDAAQRFRSLFDLNGGDALAAKGIRRELDDNGSVDGLNFWLDELRKRNSKEFEPLAAEIIARAAQGQISFETLFWVSDIYMSAQTSPTLRNRFLMTVVARTQPANFVVESPPQVAYTLLTKILPAVQQSVPELYEQALTQSFAIRASLNEQQLADEARVARLKDSANPIADLKSEADAAKTKTERNELLLQAAQLALEKKKFELCLNLLDEVETTVASSDPALWQRSIDQILKNVVRGCLTNKSLDLAEKAAIRMVSLLPKIESLNLLMRYDVKANDKDSAQRLLIDVVRIADASADSLDKAKAFLLIGMTCDQVDDSKKADLLLSSLKVLNNLSKPDSTVRDKTAHQLYVQRLDNVGYELTQGFRDLAAKDQNEALALVEKLQNPDLRTYALIGVLIGLDNLLTAPGTTAK
ncbi:MAG TPA: hypothetical protein VI306_25700 [Pyrinomonadaceae bacterium]